MTKPECDDVVMMLMAIADGYQPGPTALELEAHLDSCSECRQEVEKLRSTVVLLDAQERPDRNEDVWQLIESRLLRDSHAPRFQPTLPFFLLGLGLLGYRLIEMVPDRNLSFAFKVVPLMLAIAAFSYLRVNPFKINSELRLEGE